MTSILEPFASKRRPNETGTCSVYASVNVTKNVENNEGDVFTIKDDTAETTYNLKAPEVEAEQFKITASNAEIDKDENNAVNKRYLKEKFISKDATSITVDKVTTKNLTLKHQNGLTGQIYITNFTKPGIGTPFPAICMNYLFSLQDRTLFRTPITLVNSAGGIEFNANQWGEQDSSDYPTTKLVNLVTSEISTDEMNNMTNNNILDNVCPTYKYCNNNYMKSNVTTLTLNTISVSKITIRNTLGNNDITSLAYTRIEDGNVVGETGIKVNGISCLNDRTILLKPLTVNSNTGIEFNVNSQGLISSSKYPQGLLKNTIRSDITADQITNLTNDNLLDNVCPTYQYCENTYAKIGSGPDMTGYQKILKRKRLWKISERTISLVIRKEMETMFIEDVVDFSDFPTPDENDELEFWIMGTFNISKQSDSGSSTPLTVAGKGDGVAGLISLFMQINGKVTYIPLNWSVIFATPDRVYIKINTVGKIFARQVLSGGLPTRASLWYYSANYTNNPLSFTINLEVNATLIRTT